MNKKINAKLDEKNNMIILDNNEYSFYYEKFSNYIKKIYNIDISSYINTKYYSISCHRNLYSGTTLKHDRWQLGFLLDSHGEPDIPFTLITGHFIFNYDNGQFNLLNISTDVLAVKTFNKLPIDDVCFYIFIEFDDNIDMIGYRIEKRIFIDEYNNCSYILIDIEYMINDVQIDYIMYFNYDLKEDSPKKYKMIKKKNVNDLDIFIESKFIEMIQYIKMSDFEDIFGLKKSDFCDVEKTLSIYNNFIEDFKLDEFNKKIAILKMLQI